MAAFDAIYVLAASLWIVVVFIALGIGCRFMVKLRRRRRRMSRLIDVARLPVQVGAHGVLLLRLINEMSSHHRAALLALSRRR